MRKLFLVLLLVFLFGCVHKNLIWVEKEPVQCLGNEWEQDYLERNNIKFENYPIWKEEEIIKEFYYRRGIRIYKIKKEKLKEEIFCQACSCPRGDKIKVLINEEELGEMKEFGWK